MRVFQRERFGNFQCCVLPNLTNRRKTNARRKPRCNYYNPVVPKLSGEADAGVREYSARRQGQIFSLLEKLDVLAPELQDALR